MFKELKATSIRVTGPVLDAVMEAFCESGHTNGRLADMILDLDYIEGREDELAELLGVEETSLPDDGLLLIHL